MFSLQRNLHTRPFMYPNNNASLRRQCFAALITAVLSIPAYANLRAHAPYEPDTPWVLHEAVNLFKNATVKASSHVGHKKAELAIDGHRENKNQYWETRGEQASLTIDMGQGQPINTIRLWTAWDKSRVHKYLIEGSADGAAWHLLVDQRDNTMPATDLGRTFYFPTRTLRYIRTTFVRPDDEQEATGQIVEIAGYRLDDARIQQLLKWNDVPAGLQGAVGTIDVRYPRDFVPELDQQDTCRLVAWRGERVHAQLVLWTATGVRQVRLIHSAPRTADGREMPADAVRTRFVRYVLADGRLCADVLDTADRLDLPPQTVRPVWVSIDVPRDASPGLYTTQIRIEGADVKPLVFPVRIEVLTPVLPEPAQWSFHLDLWQNPWAVARYHHVPPFSPEHYMLMEPLLRMLAEAGQKCLTVSIVDAPWGGQTYDTFGTMIQWIRTEDGTWRYDYRLFDEWVRFGQACGIRDQINCYSMVPWTNRFRYFDEASGDYRWVEAEPGTEAYETHWRPFLVDFVAHLRRCGWLDRTAIALDERSLEQVQKLLAFVKRVAPDLKIASAGKYHQETKFDIYDLCLFIDPPTDRAAIAERVERGLPTTFYVCCGPARPNTFPTSPPAESAWLGWYAAARGYTGFLRWAYNSWVADPLYDTSFVTWPAGDCFLVYPGPRSSIRFERLREGIQAYEKVRLIRQYLAGLGRPQARELSSKLDQALEAFNFQKARSQSCAMTVRRANDTLSALAKALDALSTTSQSSDTLLRK